MGFSMAAVLSAQSWPRNPTHVPCLVPRSRSSRAMMPPLYRLLNERVSITRPAFSSASSWL